MQIPIATYRLQFNSQFTFNDAVGIIDYLGSLGISHVYASPVFKSRKGSNHGYDIVDYRVLNDVLGGSEAFDKLTSKVNDAGMGWIQDIVPNHMALDRDNELLNDLLENGPDKTILHQFDIDWNHHYESLRGKILMPILGDVYAACLERSEIKLTYEKSGFALTYYNHRFPLRIETYSTVLGRNIDLLRDLPGANGSGVIKFLGVLYVLKNLPVDDTSDGRSDEISFAKEMLWELYTQDETIRQYIDTMVKEFNGTSGVPESFTLLDNLHNEQLFKLSYWKVANEELNYRRFFTVNDLISVRVEDSQVFETMHEYLFSLVHQGKISGLRVDHIDGLYDPHTYLDKLRQSVPDAYIIVEKILGFDESLPLTWPVQGTTGYDFCNHVNQIFCSSAQEHRFTNMYRHFSGYIDSFEQSVRDGKRLILKKNMAGDIDNLAFLIKKVSSHSRWGTDITLYGLRSALVELMIHFPVYRSYINRTIFSDDDRKNLQIAINAARIEDPGLGREFDFIEQFLFLKFDPGFTEEQKIQWTEVVMRFQQFTGPLSAKGVEDTVFYDYNRLVSLNEVGGNPGNFGITTDSFHKFNKHRFRLWKHSLNTTSTHDTKRGEDTRMRINFLSEIPDDWEREVVLWRKLNSKFKTRKGREEIPDDNDEYLFYQMLVGTWPLDAEDYGDYVTRFHDYMLKAIREAKVHTAWIEYDTEYEQSVLSFVESVLDEGKSQEFLSSFIPFVRKTAKIAMYGSLSQCLLKMTVPGVPDFYQGTELWDFSMVDPDNRHCVDYKKREVLLDKIRNFEVSKGYHFFHTLLQDQTIGEAKLYLIHIVLSIRKKYMDLFRNGAYIPINIVGTFDDSVVAFARVYMGEYIIVIVSRFLNSVTGFSEYPMSIDMWDTTACNLPDLDISVWRNCITGETIHGKKQIMIRDVLMWFPCALLVPEH